MTRTVGRKVGRNLVWSGIVLIVLTGLVHLVEGPEYLEESTIIGVLFFINMAAAIVSAIGIYRGSRSWGWGLGVLVAGGALVAYVLSRTTGFLGFYDDAWLEPSGIFSWLVEGLFLITAVWVFRGLTPAHNELPRAKR